MFKCSVCKKQSDVRSVVLYELDGKNYKGSICKNCAYKKNVWLKKSDKKSVV